MVNNGYQNIINRECKNNNNGPYFMELKDVTHPSPSCKSQLMM